MPTLGTWVYAPNRTATIAAHANAVTGGADGCTCGPCRNFGLVREELFPPDFLALLDELGVDPRKDSEVTQSYRGDDGLCLYIGWFHFVGDLSGHRDAASDDEPLPDFKFSFVDEYRPRLVEFGDQDMKVLEFWCYAPWRLDEAYPGEVSPEELAVAQALPQTPTAD